MIVLAALGFLYPGIGLIVYGLTGDARNAAMTAGLGLTFTAIGRLARLIRDEMKR